MGFILGQTVFKVAQNSQSHQLSVKFINISVQKSFETFQYEQWFIEMNENQNSFGVCLSIKFILSQILFVNEFSTSHILGPSQSLFHWIRSNSLSKLFSIIVDFLSKSLKWSQLLSFVLFLLFVFLLFSLFVCFLLLLFLFFISFNKVTIFSQVLDCQICSLYKLLISINIIIEGD